jgi:hypothetical protein
VHLGQAIDAARSPVSLEPHAHVGAFVGGGEDARSFAESKLEASLIIIIIVCL